MCLTQDSNRFVHRNCREIFHSGGCKCCVYTVINERCWCKCPVTGFWSFYQMPVISLWTPKLQTTDSLCLIKTRRRHVENGRNILISQTGSVHIRTSSSVPDGMTGRHYWEVEWSKCFRNAAGVAITCKRIQRKRDGWKSGLGSNDILWWEAKVSLCMAWWSGVKRPCSLYWMQQSWGVPGLTCWHFDLVALIFCAHSHFHLILELGAF